MPVNRHVGGVDLSVKVIQIISVLFELHGATITFVDNHGWLKSAVHSDAAHL
jgi:hypothetical protein